MQLYDTHLPVKPSSHHSQDRKMHLNHILNLITKQILKLRFQIRLMLRDLITGHILHRYKVIVVQVGHPPLVAHLAYLERIDGFAGHWNDPLIEAELLFKIIFGRRAKLLFEWATGRRNPHLVFW